MDTIYNEIMIAVGVVTLLTIVWKLGRWQAQQEDRDKTQDTEIAELREELEEGKDD
jgi:hypothetical protein